MKINNAQSISQTNDFLNVMTQYAKLMSGNITSKDKIFNVIMLFVLTVLFRMTAFVILWFKGKREPIRIKNLFNKKRNKLNKECLDV